jgi:hypothetical protein
MSWDRKLSISVIDAHIVVFVHFEITKNMPVPSKLEVNFIFSAGSRHKKLSYS